MTKDCPLRGAHTGQAPCWWEQPWISTDDLSSAAPGAASLGCLHQAACSPCPPGHFCSTTGLTSPSGPCLAGFFCRGGALDPHGSLGEQAGGPCPAGTQGLPEDDGEHPRPDRHPRTQGDSSLPFQGISAPQALPLPSPALRAPTVNSLPRTTVRPVLRGESLALPQRAQLCQVPLELL